MEIDGQPEPSSNRTLRESPSQPLSPVGVEVAAGVTQTDEAVASNSTSRLCRLQYGSIGGGACILGTLLGIALLVYLVKTSSRRDDSGDGSQPEQSDSAVVIGLFSAMVSAMGITVVCCVCAVWRRAVRSGGRWWICWR